MDNILILSMEVITKVTMSIVTETIAHKDDFLTGANQLDSTFVRQTESNKVGQEWFHQISPDSPKDRILITDPGLLKELETRYLKLQYGR